MMGTTPLTPADLAAIRARHLDATTSHGADEDAFRERTGMATRARIKSLEDVPRLLDALYQEQIRDGQRLARRVEEVEAQRDAAEADLTLYRDLVLPVAVRMVRERCAELVAEGAGGAGPQPLCDALAAAVRALDVEGFASSAAETVALADAARAYAAASRAWAAGAEPEASRRVEEASVALCRLCYPGPAGLTGDQLHAAVERHADAIREIE